MIERALRTVAIVLSLIIVAGLFMFALDEFDRASSAQRNELAGFERAAPTLGAERRREQRHSVAREYVDDVNDVLLKPFATVADSGGRWLQRTVPAVLGLLVYGFALAYVARFAKGRGSGFPASRVAGRSTRRPGSPRGST